MSSEPPPQPAHKEQSQAFARRVLEAFRSRGHATDAEVVAAGGPSDSYMTQLRRAAQEGAWVPPPRRHTQKRIETAAGWKPGSAWAVWSGDEPSPTDVGAQVHTGDFVSAPGARVEGAVDDSEVLRQIIAMRAEYDQLRAEVRGVSERLEKLEKPDA